MRKVAFIITNKNVFPHVLLYTTKWLSAGQLPLFLSFYLTYYFMKSQLQSGDNLLLFKPHTVARFLLTLMISTVS